MGVCLQLRISLEPRGFSRTVGGQNGERQNRELSHGSRALSFLGRLRFWICSVSVGSFFAFIVVARVLLDFASLWSTFAKVQHP